MADNIDHSHQRRSITRREADTEFIEFTQCPKYVKHDLSREQVKEIVEEVYKQMKVDAFDEGKNALYKVIIFIGITVLAVYNILSNHPLK